MKKLIVLLLALTICAGAFAQLTVAGYDKAKATYSSDPKTVAFMDEIRLNLTANDPDGKFGFSGRFQGDSDNTKVPKGADKTTGNDFQPIYMYGWAKFFDGMLTLSGGRLNEGSYYFEQNAANSIQANIDSESAPGIDATFPVVGAVSLDTSVDVVDIRRQAMEVTLAPIAGLKASIIYTPDGNTITGSNIMYGAAYSVEKLLNLKAAFTGTSGGDVVGHVSGEFVGVENLSAVAGLKMLNDGTDGFFGIYSIVGYTMDKLFFELAGQYNTDTDILDASYYIEGNVEYTTEAYSVRAFGQYNDSKLDQKDASGDDVYSFDLGGAGEYLVGAELSIPVGAGEFNVGLNYSDLNEVKIPVYLKIAF